MDEVMAQLDVCIQTADEEAKRRLAEALEEFVRRSPRAVRGLQGFALDAFNTMYDACGASIGPLADIV